MKESTYTVLKKLGEGAGGVVYLAYHNRLKTEVVLKELKYTSGIESRREVDILKNLHHMYLPQVYDFFEKEHRVFTVMSYVPGTSMEKCIKDQTVFSQEELLRFGIQLSQALAYLHRQTPSIIHSDVKPANIMLTPEGNVCLIDFNISFLMDGSSMLGYSRGYSSPEQEDIVSGKSRPDFSLDQRSDIYSLGASLYAIAMGRVFDWKDPEFEKLEKRTSKGYAAVIRKALRQDREERFRTAEEMEAAFLDVPKVDKGYYILRHSHRVSMAAAFGVLLASILLIGFGVHRLDLENVREYNHIVEEQVEAREAGDYESAQILFEEAAAKRPFAYETFYQQACSLYDQREYAKCDSFIDYDVLRNEDLDPEDEDLYRFYYLQGNSRYYREDYEGAVDAFRKMSEYPTCPPGYWRDYVAAAAKSGEYALAKELLDQAMTLGLDPESGSYSGGEILLGEAAYTEAEEAFRNCVELTEEPELMERSYLALSELKKRSGDATAEREVLLEALQQLQGTYRMKLLQRLIQADIDLGDQKSDDQYREEAIGCIQEVMDFGWATYRHYDTLIVLYERMGDLEEAEKTIREMSEKFGEDYNTYKRTAFLCILQEECKVNEQRDYTGFREAYEKAVDLYEELPAQGDSEMELLAEQYKYVEEGGWFS